MLWTERKLQDYLTVCVSLNLQLDKVYKNGIEWPIVCSNVGHLAKYRFKNTIYCVRYYKLQTERMNVYLLNKHFHL
jgi:hypothetical protein